MKLPQMKINQIKLFKFPSKSDIYIENIQTNELKSNMMPNINNNYHSQVLKMPQSRFKLSPLKLSQCVEGSQVKLYSNSIKMGIKNFYNQRINNGRIYHQQLHDSSKIRQIKQNSTLFLLKRQNLHASHLKNKQFLDVHFKMRQKKRLITDPYQNNRQLDKYKKSNSIKRYADLSIKERLSTEPDVIKHKNNNYKKIIQPGISSKIFNQGSDNLFFKFYS